MSKVARKRRKLKAHAETRETVAAQSPPLPPDLATLPEDLHYRRERMYAIAAACRFERWLLEHIASRGIPLDNVLRAATLLPIYVEAILLARVLFQAPPPIHEEDAPDAFWTPATESEASSVGLTVRRVRSGEARPVANLPGCAGDAGTCPKFRRFGERYCGHHRRLELERIRKQQ